MTDDFLTDSPPSWSTHVSRRDSEQVQSIRWYHRMHLPGGITTDGVSNTDRGLPRLRLPESLAGKSVLDIGAWDGFYSFEAARRGADQVLATDSFAWSGVSWGTKDGFELARRLFELEETVADMDIDVMELSPEKLGQKFDVVLLLGVLYHLKDPIGALERAASACNEVLIVETETSLNWLPYPAARFYPNRELGQDDTNWFAFNSLALCELLRSLGFTRVDVMWRASFPRRLARAVIEKRSGGSFRPMLRSGRVVIHAHRL
jgi:tRNA (mo5U34)-methyltransferase